MTSRGRRRALVAGVVAAVAGGLVLLVRPARTAPDRAPFAAPPAPARPAAAEPDPAPAPPPAPAAPAVFPSPSAARRELPTLPPQALTRTTADDYRRRARYPRSSHPLAPDEDPIARDRDVTPITEHGPNGRDPSLTVFPALPGFEDPEPVVLLAYLSIGDERIAAREMTGTVTTEALEPLGEVTYHDDGVGGDQEAGDGLYTTVFVPPPGDALAESFLVKVHAVALGDVERFAATSFLYSRPRARLTGRFRDAAVDGSLHVEAEVEVLAIGRFHLEASLADATGGRQLAWAQSAAELPPGVHWMPLDYYGLILREADVGGPYLLRRVALSTTSDMPNAKNRLLENAYLTAAYPVTAFTDQPFQDPALLDAADRLERDGLAGGLGAGG
jgi:hypothetical protein